MAKEPLDLNKSLCSSPMAIIWPYNFCWTQNPKSTQAQNEQPQQSRDISQRSLSAV